ncbi:MAG: DUF4350 domain-containing protein [Candidatus Saccharimonas sp.]|nr:DUF4350 domain-containing protein [Planctomycetaceae bacterium]
MLSARNAVLAALAVFALSMIAGTVSLMGPPDSHGAAVDSYGTHRDGYRAVFELLSAFDVPVERRIEPPSPDLPTSTTLVLWMPHDDLVANEPAYLERLLPWVERGGRLVVATQPPGRNWLSTVMQAVSRAKKGGDLWTTLKLPGVRPISISLTETNDDPSGTPSPRRILHSEAARREEIRRAMEESMGLHPVQFTTVTVTVSGAFGRLRDRVRKLQFPTEDLGGLEIDDSQTTRGVIECVRPNGDPWTVAASFERGRGEIVVVAEPMLLMNASVAQVDNSSLAFDLLVSEGRRVVFDEFYHGLSVRGNPLWLLTKSSYAVVTLAIVGLLALELWRRAVLLGPPLEATAKTRRTIIEYIEAMARFLNRARNSRPFLLSEVRGGVLRTVGDRLGLSPSKHHPDAIAAKMSKRSPREADQFREVMQQLDAALIPGSTPSETEAIRLLQRISRCL